MTLVRWQPRRLFDFPTDLDRFFEGFWTDSGNGNRRASVWNPAMDVSESEDEVVVHVELPGLKKDEIRVSVNRNVLSIEGEKTQASEDKEARYHRTERVYGSFKRSFTLPPGVDAEKISAAYKDGVLTLSLPKAETAKPKAIEIK